MIIFADEGHEIFSKMRAARAARKARLFFLVPPIMLFKFFICACQFWKRTLRSAIAAVEVTAEISISATVAIAETVYFVNGSDIKFL